MKLGGYPVILLQLIICCGIFTTAEKRRSHFVLRFILCFLVSTALTLSFEYIEIGGIYRNVLRFLILYSIILGITFICFDVKFKDAVFDCTGGYALQHSIYCVIVIVTYFFPFNQLLRENIFLRYLCIHLPVTIPVAAVAYAVLIRPMKKKGLFNEKDISCVFLSVIVLFCAILLNEFSRFTIAGELNRFTTNVVCKAYSLLCCILVLFLQFFIFRLRKTEKDKEFIEYVFGQKKEQYNFSRETIDLINMKYHDLKHYIGVMKNLEDDERISMANEIEKYIKSYDGIVRTGNESLDVILTENSLRCIDKKIKFSYSVDAEAFSFIEPIDIYSIFGNALDNAIRSVSDADEDKRIISLKAFTQNRMLFINIENYCDKEIEFRDGLPVTHGDTKYHGYGTRSIDFIVKKYGGHMRMSLKDNMFFVGIVIPVKE